MFHFFNYFIKKIKYFNLRKILIENILNLYL